MEVVKGLINMEEAANFLGIKKSSLYSLTMRKQLPVCKLGKLNMFRLKDLEAFIESRMVNND
ncbi:helix-turn-helix domain-containing protein [Candidatus Kuenenia sp.]|uniref:helix-turn-helix domain-containing protein n=1 Tax=Candidatus Kuenenia sp. TaxID=2499824 RepID=UPI0032207115